jgi:hypothetical protein
VEKDAINKIITDTLPSNGSSCDIMSASDGQIKKIKNIPWIVYNNCPATLSI